MKFQDAIRQRILDLLAERKMTIYQLYVKSGIPKSSLYDVIKNTKKHVSALTIYQICASFGISLSEFYNTPLFDNIED